MENVTNELNLYIKKPDLQVLLKRKDGSRYEVEEEQRKRGSFFFEGCGKRGKTGRRMSWNRKS